MASPPDPGSQAPLVHSATSSSRWTRGSVRKGDPGPVSAYAEVCDESAGPAWAQARMEPSPAILAASPSRSPVTSVRRKPLDLRQGRLWTKGRVLSVGPCTVPPMSQEMLPERWESRDLPVLRAAAAHLESGELPLFG